MPPEFSYVLRLAGVFLLWTLWSYGVHVLAHRPGRLAKPLRMIHRAHHAYEYDESRLPPLSDYFFWFGSWRASLDVYITFTIPLLVVTVIDPAIGLPLLAFHYVYEVFLSRNVLDHNPNLRGVVTRFVPVGRYHLLHHSRVTCNYSFYITLWDVVFRTGRTPSPDWDPRPPRTLARTRAE